MKVFRLCVLFLIFSILIVSCSKKSPTVGGWYEDAVFYHIWVKSFADSDDEDKIGDIKGIIEKLDYLNDGDPKTDTDLGVTAIWLSPIFECGLKARNPEVNMHGYDTTDYYKINDIFGTEKDVEKLLEEAHKRGIKVVFDFVINHTSSEHPWFINASDKGDKRDWYVWSDNPDPNWKRPWGQGDWTDVWKENDDDYYYSAFLVSSLADLNLRNSDVRKEQKKIIKYWLDKGFDGIRADAVRYLFEDGPLKAADRPETHEYLKEIRAYMDTFVDEKNPKETAKVFIGEVWADKEKIKDYYGNGTDEFHMCFDFPISYGITKAVNGMDSVVVQEIFDYEKSNYPKGYRTATFLSNHDNVVSRPYTSFFGNTKKCVQAASLNILSPGTPFIYYGNEIGMEGLSGEDINLRKAFDWEKYKLEVKDSNSIFSWYRRLIKLRKKYPAIIKGDFQPVSTSNSKVRAYLRTLGDENILMVYNFTNKEKDVTIDFSLTKLPATGVSMLIGDLQGDKSLKENYKAFKVNKLPANGFRIYYIGDKIQANIFGDMK